MRETLRDRLVAAMPHNQTVQIDCVNQITYKGQLKEVGVDFVNLQLADNRDERHIALFHVVSVLFEKERA